MRDSEKARVCGIFGGIQVAIIAAILIAGLWQAGQDGLLTPDWWKTFVAESQRP